MNEDARKTLLRAIPHGLYVVTTGEGATAHGFTATWLTQASFKPPLLMMGVKRDSHAYTTITGNRSFVVNYVGKDGRAICEKFFQAPTPAKSPTGDAWQFGSIEFTKAPVTGGPLLVDAIGFVECRVVHVYDGGDHSVVIGEVIDAQILKTGEPLVLADTPWKYGG